MCRLCAARLPATTRDLPCLCVFAVPLEITYSSSLRRITARAVVAGTAGIDKSALPLQSAERSLAPCTYMVLTPRELLAWRAPCQVTRWRRRGAMSLRDGSPSGFGHFVGSDDECGASEPATVGLENASRELLLSYPYRRSLRSGVPLRLTVWLAMTPKGRDHNVALKIVIPGIERQLNSMCRTKSF